MPSAFVLLVLSCFFDSLMFVFMSQTSDFASNVCFKYEIHTESSLVCEEETPNTTMTIVREQYRRRTSPVSHVQSGGLDTF